VVSYWDEPFNVHSTTEIYVPVRVNVTTKTVIIDREAVDQLLGTTTGNATSADDLVLILNAAFTEQNVGMTSVNTGGYIIYEVDETVNKAAGSKTLLGVGPAYHGYVKYVASLIPALRQISGAGTPSSPYFKMNIFCASDNFDAFMLPLLLPAGKYRRKLQL